MGANQNARKLLSTDLVNTNTSYFIDFSSMNITFERLNESQREHNSISCEFKRKYASTCFSTFRSLTAAVTEMWKKQPRVAYVWQCIRFCAKGCLVAVDSALYCIYIQFFAFATIQGNREKGLQISHLFNKIAQHNFNKILGFSLCDKALVFKDCSIL